MSERLKKPADGGVDESRNILFEISNRTHEYVKTLTTQLTALRDFEGQRNFPPVSYDDTSAGVADHPTLSTYVKRQHSSTPPDEGDSGGVLTFAKDYARIVHSPSFRRLQGKTQLIPAGENEFFRTRLTHSLEVADIATRIARRFNAKYDYFRRHPINYELVSCASLLHDIGHPPFGHSGEEMLDRKMRGYGGFGANAQTLRIATKLENRLGRSSQIADVIARPRGLNLSAGTLASVLKYDVKLPGPMEEAGELRVKNGYYPSEEPAVQFLRYQYGVAPGTKLATIECQIMDIADDIAYSAYDLEDTLEAGIVTPFDLMSIDDKTLGMIELDVRAEVVKHDPSFDSLPSKDLMQLILMHLTGVFGSLLDYGDTYDFKKDLDKLAFVGRTYAESIHHARNPLVRRQYLETLIERNINSLHLEFNRNHPFLSVLKVEPNRLLLIESMKAFNFRKVITSRRLQLQHHRNRRIIGGIFDALEGGDGPAFLSEIHRDALLACGTDVYAQKRLIADIISSLTDLEAMNLYDQLNSTRNGGFWNYSR